MLKSVQKFIRQTISVIFAYIFVGVYSQQY